MAESDDSVDFIQRRLSAVQGYSDRVNDIFVTGTAQTCNKHIIFFGGDVQDYPEKMESHRDNKRHVEWNTEATAKMVFHKFPDSVVFVIKPAYMHLMTFSAYLNFWAASESGSPLHCENNNALEHLFKLYHSAVEQVYGKDGIPDKVPIYLVGFSKGCTVLNQLVYELHLLKEKEHLNDFATRFKQFFWLDGGHSGGPENTWVTQDAALQDLASLHCEVNIHVTPYQIKDPLRVWVGKEEAKFYKKLKKLKVNVHQTIHFEADPPSIENHFSVLKEF